ncbi:uncharacterized protein LOC110843838 isoform X1 [Folsomia candida]|uniref:O-acyltransferase WSD1 C-terminal domain-containing protein n=1 Tax=Folsomia candida TaxID=158441 RepID=A0A226ESL7_FOLCA|nr:uncharacterized protein LOC110843838 isoform X1 [Folsomia candida]OXA60603.1 hypothetical protein Fcan01_04665 [Folsomia candida]
MEERDIKDGNLLYEKLTYFMKSWLGYRFWSRESNFSLHEHIRFFEDTEHLLMSQPEQNVVTEEDFLKVMGNLATRPFRQGMSPWEILIVRNFVPSKPKIHIGEETKISEGSRFILICRMHHSICDGYCVFKMFVNNLGGVPVIKISPSWTETFCSTIMTSLGTLVLSPYYQFKQTFLDADRNIWKLPPSQMTEEWLTVRSEKIPLTGLKNISKSRNVSLTALFNTGLGGGIRAFLKGTGQEDKIPEIMRSVIPFQWKTHPLTGLVNCWTFGVLTIPLGPCLQHNLQTAEQSIMSLRKSPNTSTNFALAPIVTIAPIWLCKILLKFNLTVISSNFPGPKDPHQSFDRYWLDDITLWLELNPGFGMSATFLTALDNLRVGVTVDKRIIPTQEKADYLAFCINEEFKNILDMNHVNENMEQDDAKIV